jgi:hypothetical protein
MNKTFFWIAICTIFIGCSSAYESSDAQRELKEDYECFEELVDLALKLNELDTLKDVSYKYYLSQDENYILFRSNKEVRSIEDDFKYDFHTQSFDKDFNYYKDMGEWLDNTNVKLEKIQGISYREVIVEQGRQIIVKTINKNGFFLYPLDKSDNAYYNLVCAPYQRNVLFENAKDKEEPYAVELEGGWLYVWDSGCHGIS